MYYIWANFAQSTLVDAIDDAQTHIQVASASKFPQPGDVTEKFTIVVGDPADVYEIMLVTAVMDDEFEVVRGYDQTTPQAFDVDALVVHQPTAEAYRWMSRAALDFNRKFIGSVTVAPSVDSNGDPLMAGAFYFNTAQGRYYSWDGASWSSPDTLPIAQGTQRTIEETDYLLKASDNMATLRFTNDSAITVTVPEDILNPMQSDLFQAGNGVITVVGSGGAVLESPFDRDLKHRSTAGRGMTVNVWMDDNPDGTHAHYWVRGETAPTPGAV